MEKRRFILCDPDPVYVDRFMDYLQRKPNFLFSVIGFTGTAEMRTFLETNGADLALVDEACWEQTEEELRKEVRKRIPCLVLLADRQRSAEEYDSVCRYQSMEKMLPEILRYYEERVPAEPAAEVHTQLDVFYSPSGRCGRTTCAMLLGHRLSEECGRSVLYMNLEAVSGQRKPPSDDREEESGRWKASADGNDPAASDPGGGLYSSYASHSLSDLLYARQTGSPMKLQSLTRSVGSLSVLDPVMNPEDMWQLPGSELQAVLLEIQSLGIYDSVILDLGPDRDPLPVLSVCSRVFLTDGTEEFAHAKLDHFLDYVRQSQGKVPENWHRIRPSHMKMLEDREPGTRCRELEEWLEKEWRSWN